MYAVKVLHGYITPQGKRTRSKCAAKVFNDEVTAKKFAKRIGGRVKQIG